MAFMPQEKKKEIHRELKAALKGFPHKLRWSLAVRHHSTLVLTVREGDIDPFADRVPDRWSQPMREEGYVDVNVYHWHRHFTGATFAFLRIVLPILNRGNFDKSDPMTDYFHVGWYVDVRFGKWDKPYVKMES